MGRRAAAFLSLAVLTLACSSGEPVKEYELSAKVGLSILRNPESPDDIPHNLRTAVIGPDGRLVRIYNGFDWTPDELLTDLAQAAG